MKKIAIVAGLVALLAAGAGGIWASGLLGGAAEAAATKEARSEAAEDPKAARKLPDIIYVQLDPLAAPVIGGGRIRYNVLLTLSLEIGDQNEKSNVAKLMPRLRDAMLMELYAQPIVRDDESGRIDLESVKERMFAVARDIVGAAVVRDLLVVSAIRAG